MRVLFSSLALAVLVTALPGCSSEDESNGPSARGCAADGRKDVYTQGLTKTAGALSVRLLEATPAPPAKGTNAMTIEVVDAGGAPVDDATITVTPFMPDHGHGSAVKPEVAAAGGGKYTVTKIYLAMAGLWEIKVSVQRPGEPAQETTFNFCLDG